MVMVMGMVIGMVMVMCMVILTVVVMVTVTVMVTVMVMVISPSIPTQRFFPCGSYLTSNGYHCISYIVKSHLLSLASTLISSLAASLYFFTFLIILRATARFL